MKRLVLSLSVALSACSHTRETSNQAENARIVLSRGKWTVWIEPSDPPTVMFREHERDRAHLTAYGMSIFNDAGTRVTSIGAGALDVLDPTSDDFGAEPRGFSVFADQDGSVWIEVSVREGSESRQAFALQCGAEGEATRMILGGGENRGKIVMEIREDGTPHLTALDAEGAVLWRMP